MRNLATTIVSIDSLKIALKHARIHSKAQIRLLSKSMTRFGWTMPILVDAEGEVIAGAARLMAAKELGMKEVPVICIEDLTEAQVRAYRLADNQIALNATWDPEILSEELKFLYNGDFAIEDLGFDTTEIDFALGTATPNKLKDEERVVEPDRTKPAVTQVGDIWCLGKHRILCGDATREDAFEALLGDQRAQMVFSDPPYNVRIPGHASGKGGAAHPDFAMASGEMSAAAFSQFLEANFRHLVNYSISGSVHFHCMDWRHSAELLEAALKVYSAYLNLCVWTKTNGGMGSLYRSQHELVHVFKTGRSAHINNVALGKYGRNRTNVWEYAGTNVFKSERSDELAMHPTVKPMALVADAILDCSKLRGIILDPFAGSGTTILAAEQTGRVGYALEIDPHYVDVSIQRWQAVVRKEAIHVKSGKSFSVLAAEA